MCSCKNQRPKKYFLKLLNDQGMNYYLNLCKSICKLGPTFCSLYRRLLFRWQIVPFGIPNNTPFITINIIAQTIEHFLLSLNVEKNHLLFQMQSAEIIDLLIVTHMVTCDGYRPRMAVQPPPTPHHPPVEFF